MGGGCRLRRRKGGRVNLRSFCSRAGLGYQELIVDDSLINKVYEITFSPAARSSTLGIPDGCVDVQFLGSGAQEECFVAGSLLKGHRSDSSCYERCFGIKFMPGPKCCFSKLDAQALFNRRIEASAYVDIDVLRDIVHLSLPFEERARLAASHFAASSHSELFCESDSLVSFITKVILDRVGVVRVEDVVERTGYSHTYVSKRFKEAVGCTMKTYASIIRTQNAIRFLSDSRYRGVTGLDIRMVWGITINRISIREFKKYDARPWRYSCRPLDGFCFIDLRQLFNGECENIQAFGCRFVKNECAREPNPRFRSRGALIGEARRFVFRIVFIRRFS